MTVLHEREPEQHADEHRPPGQPAQRGGEGYRGEERRGRVPGDQKPDPPSATLEALAHPRQQPGREQFGHHGGEGRREQGEQSRQRQPGAGTAGQPGEGVVGAVDMRPW